MASALLRMGRIKGVARPAIATPIPSPTRDVPTLLLDAGANSECQAEWLVQFAQMGAAFSRLRYSIESPRIGLLSIGEEPTKGTSLVKQTHALLAEAAWPDGISFVGNVEGRDLMDGPADVVVTDGFTGNVALKSLEGAMRSLVGSLFAAFEVDEAAKEAAKALAPALLPLYDRLDPDSTGGAVLLGVDGICIISHGSSSARAIVNAVRVAHESVQSDVVGALRASVAA
jgi:glycerol-3-phosphate acyltransferase PlsX